MNIRNLLLLFIAFSLLISCEKEESFSYDVSKKSGYYILNEGAFGKSNASIGFIPDQGQYNFDLFSRVNGRNLGDVMMSMAIDEDTNLGYILLNNSNKVEVIDAHNFTEKGLVKGFDNPRYMVVEDGVGYVSQWGDNGCVKVVDLKSNSISSTISTGFGAEGILVFDNKLWVANSGGYGNDSTLSVINLQTNQVEQLINVGDKPYELVLDKDDNIWVLCAGYTQYSEDYSSIVSQTPSKLVQVSSQNYEIIKQVIISDTDHPIRLAISPERTTLYFGGGYGFNGIFAQDISALSISDTPLIDGSFYGVETNPVTGQIIGTMAPSFTDPGSVNIYSKSGLLLNDYKVGIGPNTVLYKN